MDGDLAPLPELCELAERGRRGAVDLLVSDIYLPGEVSLPGELTAASFGRIAAENGRAGDPRPEDLAAGVMGLVGENVALICGGLAGARRVDRIVYGGTTLRENPALSDTLKVVTAGMGLRCTILPSGEFAGAVGALQLAGRSQTP